MNNLGSMIWIEMRKAIRSNMPLWTALGSLFLPFGIGFLIFVSRNPEISKQLGLISAKADLMAYSATDWPAYLNLFGLLLSAVGLILFSLVVSWVFGREFADGTLKDLLAVPVQRSNILLAKFILVAAWCAALTVIIFIAGLALGAFIRLPGGSSNVILHGSLVVTVSAGMAILVGMPFALLASVGRGYLLPMAGAIVALMAANLVGLVGWGDYYPWAIPGLYAMGESPLAPVSYWIVLLTSLAGMLATYLWWMRADQNR
jgi:ABC-2 type transport system permease protein